MRKTTFGRTDDAPNQAGQRQNREATLFLLEAGDYCAAVTDYGATLVSLSCPDKHGKQTDVILGFDDVQPYTGDVGYMGAVIGRFANRIDKGQFILNGKRYVLAINDAPNHLHGGTYGFNRKFFCVSHEGENTITFHCCSPDGEEGYPGNLELTVTYTLSADGTLTIEYSASCDADTVMNITNHAYFNPSGTGERESADNLLLWVDASAFCDGDEHCLANGNILNVEKTPLDFRTPAKLGERLSCTDYPPIQAAGGIDHCFVLSTESKFRRAACLFSEQTGIGILCATDQPGIQIYTGNFMRPMQGKSGARYDWRGAVCMETQGFPNATSFAHFPSPILRRGETYHQKTTYSLFVADNPCMQLQR